MCWIFLLQLALLGQCGGDVVKQDDQMDSDYGFKIDRQRPILLTRKVSRLDCSQSSPYQHPQVPYRFRLDC